MSGFLRYTMTLSAALLLGITSAPSAYPTFGTPTASAKPIENARVPSQGTYRVVALFAKFPDEAPEVTSPPAWGLTPVSSPAVFVQPPMAQLTMCEER